MNDVKLFIFRDNQEYGPYSVDEVRGFLASGHASMVDNARAEDSQNWETVRELVRLLPPIPQSTQSSSLPPPYPTPTPVSVLPPIPTVPPPVPPTLTLTTDEQDCIRRIADYERIACYFWIVLGVVQICLIATAIAGIWNIFASISRWNLPEKVRSRDARIPKAYQDISQLIIIGVVNLLLGGVIGVVFVAFDFYIRDMVLKNSHLFTGMPHSSIYPSQSSAIPLPVAGSGFDQQLRTLAKLRDDGVITEEEFSSKKREILGMRL